MNENAGGGHCFGFAALAGLFATGQLDKADYLPAGLSVYEAPPSDLLDGLITRYASTQYSPPTNSARAAFPVAGIVEELEAAWDAVRTTCSQSSGGCRWSRGNADRGA